MGNKKLDFLALAMAAFLALHAAAAARDLPKETPLKPKPEAVEPAAAPTGSSKDDKHFIAFGGMGGVAGIGGVVGVLPIGDMGGNGLGGIPGGLGGLGGDPGGSGKGGVCGTGGGLAGAVGRRPVVPLVP